MSSPIRSDLGGVVRLQGNGWGHRDTIIHFGPEPGACSVDEDGCGYCIGVPCRWPSTATTEDGDTSAS